MIGFNKNRNGIVFVEEIVQLFFRKMLPNEK